MTIALAVLTNDGLVLASDSATTLMATDPKTGAMAGVFNVYNNANKVFNLHKVPQSGPTRSVLEASAIRRSPCSRRTFAPYFTSGEPIGKAGWVFDPASYSIEKVAVAFREFVFEDKYKAAHPASGGPKPRLGFKIGGYSAGSGLPGLWSIDIDVAGRCPPPSQLRAPGKLLGSTGTANPKRSSALSSVLDPGR